MTLYDLKPRFQALLRPSVGRLAAAGVTANQVTLAAVLLSLLAGLAIALAPGHPAPLLALPVVLLVRMALNAVDGMLAREHGQASRLGLVLNEMGDLIADAALYLPLAGVAGLSPALVVAVVFLAFLTEFAGLLAVPLGGARRYDGPAGKSDRALVFGLLGLLAGLQVPLATFGNLLLGIEVVLLTLTVINRLRRALCG